MKHFSDAIRQALRKRNWYAALSLALTMPDICGHLSGMGNRGRERYEAWWNRYIAKHYAGPMPSSKDPFLVSADAYALRCSFLHQGDFGILEQRIQERLSNIQPIVPGIVGHRNIVDDILYIEVDKYCLEICDGVEEWLNENRETEGFALAILNLGRIKEDGILDGSHSHLDRFKPPEWRGPPSKLFAERFERLKLQEERLKRASREKEA